MPFKKRLRTFGIFLVNAAIGIMIERALSFNVLMGVSLVVVLFEAFLAYLLWGMPLRLRRVDWAERQPKPTTQIEMRADEK